MKKSHRITAYGSFLFLCLFLFSHVLFSAEIVVDRSGGGDHEFLSDAVAAAFANDEADEIIVKPGVYVNEQNVGEVLLFSGSDDITIRGENAADPPIIVVEPNFDSTISDNFDGIVIQMGGRLTFDNLILVPSEAFTWEDNVDDLIAVFNAGVEGNPSSLELTLRNVTITHSDSENQPVTLDGFDDPRFLDNTLRDDAINIDANGPPDDRITLLLDHVIITGYGTESGSDGIVLDGPEIDAVITGGSRLTFIRRRAIFGFNMKSLTIEGTDDDPVLIYGAGETMIRASAGVNDWRYLWCVGLNEGGDGITTGFAARVDPNGGASLTASNCIFSTAQYDGIFMNFDAETPISYELRNCTFHNVPELIRFGFVGQPGPSANVTMHVIDTIVDNLDWTAPNDGTYWAPEPTLVHYGDADNTLAQLTLTNTAFRTQTFISSMSGSQSPVTEGNTIEITDFQFASEVLTRDNLDTFLVAENNTALEGKGTNGSFLGGARSEPGTTSVSRWPLY